MRPLMRRLALAAICLGVLAVTVRFGSFVAGGSDSYCYVHQAERWASGRLLAVEPLALEAPWPEASLTFAPAGHRPSPTRPGAIVPICPSGLSMLMAVFLLAGGPVAMFVVVPFCGIVLVWATEALGSRVSPGVGLAAALVTAASPIVLYQVIQPMSDVPAAAFWILALACATGTRRHGSGVAGLCAGAAILIRPNLVPLGLVIGVSLLCRGDRPWGARLRDGARYAAGSAVGCVAVAAIQQYFYGSPLASGYGTVGEIFSLAHVVPNAARYGAWLLESQGPLLVLVVIAPVLLPRSFAITCAAFCLATVGVYLPYLVFDDWSYVRFLLPAIPVLIVLMLGAIEALARRVAPPWTTVVLSLAATVLVATALPVAASHQTFRLRQLESSFAHVGDALAARLPPNALVITSRYSGSVRYYAHRTTLVWDVLDPAWLDGAVAFARAKGREPYLLLDSSEEAAFMQRFGASGLSRLDWPPRVEIAPQVRLYEPAARERYAHGETVATEYVR